MIGICCPGCSFLQPSYLCNRLPNHRDQFNAWVTHHPDYCHRPQRQCSAFQVGSPAILEVAAIAQDGLTASLKSLAQSAPKVIGGIYEGTPPTPPGKSTTFTLTTTSDKSHLTLLAMLGNTNEPFIDLPGIPLPTDATHNVQTMAPMDTGVEDNDENWPTSLALPAITLSRPQPFPGKAKFISVRAYTG